MSTRLILLASVLALSCALARGADDPRREMSRGTTDFRQSRFDEAAQAFDRAAQGAAAAKLDTAPPRYNQGNALFRMGEHGEASARYADALRSTDLELQAKAYFNRGNALFAMAESEEATNELDTAVRAIDEALKMYESSMTLSPRDVDSKVNYELALRKKQELEQRQQEQQQQQQQDQQQKQDEQKQEQKQDEQSKDQQDEQKQQEQQDEQQQHQQQQEQQGREGEEQQEAQSRPSEEMTPEEARMLLDAAKQDEQNSRGQMRLIIGQPLPVTKDW